MRFYIICGLLICLGAPITGQNTSFRILPEGGLSLPSGDFKSQNVFGSEGYLAGLNLGFFKGKFGLELYGGINSNGTKYVDGLPPESDLITSRTNRITKDSWKQLLVGLGPTYKMGLTEKLDLEFSLKFGFSKFMYPDYVESIETGAPLDQSYIMYETRNQDVEKKLNPMMRSALQFHFKPSDKIAISLGANYTSAMGVLHSYTFLDGDFNPEMFDEQLETALRTAPMVTNVYKCTFNSIGITLGVGFIFGGNDKPKDDPKEDEKMEPPIPQYPEDGSTITPEEADSLVLEWVKETPNVKKANYNFWLYEVRDSTRKHDSLIYKTKVEKGLKLLLPDNIKLRPDSAYRYMVQAIDDPQLKPCPDGCNSVEYRFEVSGSLLLQYYELLTKNSGNYISIGNAVRIQVPRGHATGGSLMLQIQNEKGEEVFVVKDLEVNREGPSHNVDVHDRVTINTSSFKAGNYLLVLRNARNEEYYLRFLKSGNVQHEKK